MVSRAYAPPLQIISGMVPLIASEDIDYGEVVALDTSELLGAILQDNSLSGVIPAIGLATNFALAGQTVYVLTYGSLRIESSALAGLVAGEFIGTDPSISAPGIPVDVGGSELSDTVIIKNMSIVGYVLSSDSDGATVLVQPSNYIFSSGAVIPDLVLTDGVSAIDFVTADGSIQLQDGNGDTILLGGTGSPGIDLELFGDFTVNLNGNQFLIDGSPLSAPTFHDNIVPSTFTTNNEYILPSAPNPTASLQVFIDDTALGVVGCNKLLVQGVDYHLTTGNTHIKYDVTPTATNDIVCFYRS